MKCLFNTNAAALLVSREVSACAKTVVNLASENLLSDDTSMFSFS